ncbi:hypothetical protein ACKWTF_010398 [Chironomus riparius]
MCQTTKFLCCDLESGFNCYALLKFLYNVIQITVQIVAFLDNYDDSLKQNIFKDSIHLGRILCILSTVIGIFGLFSLIGGFVKRKTSFTLFYLISNVLSFALLTVGTYLSQSINRIIWGTFSDLYLAYCFVVILSFYRKLRIENKL